MINDDDHYAWHFIFSEFVKRVRDNIKAALMPEKENEEMPVFLSTNMLDKKGKLREVGHYRPFPDEKKSKEKKVVPAVTAKTKKEPAAEEPKQRESKVDRLRREIEELKAKLNKSERF